MTLFDVEYSAATMQSMDLTVKAAIDDAIAANGADKAVSFPAYCIQPSLLLWRNRNKDYQPG